MEPAVYLTTTEPTTTESQRLTGLPPRPFLKWAGGKARLLAQYQPHLPERFQTYHEPFLGGGALFFHLAPGLAKAGKRAHLSDLNPELVNVYCCVRDRLDGVIERLEDHRLAHSEDHYYATRAQTDLPDLDRAARFMYLNKTCYNGLYRENSKGQFNVPMGRYKKPCICDPDLLQAASRALQMADIQVRPFEAVLDRATGAEDFVYFDPPYHPLSETSRFTAYSRFNFKAEEQIRLQQVFAQLTQRGVQCLLSNSDCPFIRELYGDFETHTITAARSINSKAKKRGKITEVLVTSCW